MSMYVLADVDAPQQGAVADDALVCCACCCQPHHLSCLSATARQRLLQKQEPWLCSDSCRTISRHLAQLCSQGMMQVDALSDGTPVSWQLIQPAAVALASQPYHAGAAQDRQYGCSTAHAPGYSAHDAALLKQVLADAGSILFRQLGPVHDVRTWQDTLPWLLSGLRRKTPGGLVDVSNTHVAVLWVGATVVSVSVVRVFGKGMYEVLLSATAPGLQGKQLGKLLARCVEQSLRSVNVGFSAMAAVIRPAVGISLVPPFEDAPTPHDPLDVDLLVKPEDVVNVADNTASGSGQLLLKTTIGTFVRSWAITLGYHLAGGAECDQLARYPLRRYSYVGYLVKKLTKATAIAPVKMPTVRAVPAPQVDVSSSPASPRVTGPRSPRSSNKQRLPPAGKGHTAGHAAVAQPINIEQARVELQGLLDGQPDSDMNTNAANGPYQEQQPALRGVPASVFNAEYNHDREDDGSINSLDHPQQPAAGWDDGGDDKQPQLGDSQHVLHPVLGVRAIPDISALGVSKGAAARVHKNHGGTKSMRGHGQAAAGSRGHGRTKPLHDM